VMWLWGVCSSAKSSYIRPIFAIADTVVRILGHVYPLRASCKA
jgi:hypothetical protein